MGRMQLAALGVAAIACVWDVRTSRIPNILTFGAAAVAVLAHIVGGGMSGGMTSIGGWLVGMAVLFIPYALGGMGAGDVKLLGALGAWLGPAGAIWLALYTGIAGGVLALVVAGMRGYLRQAGQNVWLLLMYWRVAGIRPMPGLTLRSSGSPRLAYAVPILAGTMATIWLQ